MSTRPHPGALLAAGGVLALVAVVSVLAADAAGGGALALLDAGAVARHGGPVASLIADLAAAVLLGGAVVAGWLLREDEDRVRAMALVAIAGGVTTLARGVSLLFSYAVATGQAVGSARFGSDLLVFVSTDLGVWLVTAVVLAAIATTAAATGSSVGLARTVAVLAGLLAFSAAMTGHAAGDSSHEVATSTMLVHLLAVGVWLGGLGTLQLLPERSRDDARVVHGYSHLALVCWIALALSGVWALAVRMNGPGDLLTSAYVQIGLAKAALLIALGVLGALQRRELATAGTVWARGSVAAYRRLALLELVLMALAVSLAAAMSSSPPPAEQSTPPSGPAGLLTGYELPPAPELPALLAQWRPAPFHLALCAVVLLVWWRAAAPARQRRATVRLLLGLGALLVLTQGPFEVYATVASSAHLLQHVLLAALAGVLIGSALTVPERWRALTGRAQLLLLLPAAAPLLLVGAAYGVSPVLRLALDSHPAHLALQLMSLLAGVLPVLAVRASTRPLLLAAVPLALTAAGVAALLGTDVLLAASWFGATGRTWWADALADQRRGGAAVLGVALLTAIAAVVTLLLRRSRIRRAASAPSAGARGAARGR
ncbi:cytochrome c oxidase assembly protein [Brachybacterium horti]